MSRYTIFVGLLCLAAFPLYAQNWTKEDSLRLHRLLRHGIHPRKIKLTLFPYTANTPYNWDPVRQRKIDVDENTWRGDSFYELKTLTVYSNWAKSPLDAGPRESLEQIEATGLRYAPVGQAGSHMVYGWSSVGRPSGYSLMPEEGFWKVKARKRRARTLEALRTYADSTRLEPRVDTLQSQ